MTGNVQVEEVVEVSILRRHLGIRVAASTNASSFSALNVVSKLDIDARLLAGDTSRPALFKLYVNLVFSDVVLMARSASSSRQAHSLLKSFLSWSQPQKFVCRRRGRSKALDILLQKSNSGARCRCKHLLRTLKPST